MIDVDLPQVPDAIDAELEDPNSPWGVRGIPIAVRRRIKVAATMRNISQGALLTPALKWLLDNGWLGD